MMVAKHLIMKLGHAMKHKTSGKFEGDDLKILSAMCVNGFRDTKLDRLDKIIHNLTTKIEQMDIEEGGTLTAREVLIIIEILGHVGVIEKLGLVGWMYSPCDECVDETVTGKITEILDETEDVAEEEQSQQ